MPFIDTSDAFYTSDAQIATLLPSSVNDPVITSPPPAVSSSIVATLSPPSVSTIIPASVTQTANYLQSALRSITSTFGGSKTSLASTISGAFLKTFTNTLVKSAATTTTAISDPVKTNLLGSTTPLSTAFKIDSLGSGSQPLGVAGATSTVGSGSGSMVSTSLTTLLNRFNLDSPTNLNSSLTSAVTKNTLTSLFSSTDLDGGTSLLADSNITKSQSSLTSLTAITPDATLNNDLASFLGHATPVSTATGQSDLSSYYLSDSSISLTNQDGALVSTNQSGVDAETANAILSIIKIAGCTPNNSYYSSSNELSSLYNLALTLAAKNGMTSEVSSLLGCSHSTTQLGQQSLTNAFKQSSGSQLSIASAILGAIGNPTSLNTQTIRQSVVTNPKLTSGDVPAVNNIFSSLGTNTQTAFTIPGYDDPSYPVYDQNLLSTAQPSFVNAVYQDSTLTDYFNSVPVNTDSFGQLTII